METSHGRDCSGVGRGNHRQLIHNRKWCRRGESARLTEPAKGRTRWVNPSCTDWDALLARRVTPRDDPAAGRNVMSVATMKFSAVLWGFAQLMKLQARRHEKFRNRLRERNLVAQIKARDEEVGRWFQLRNGIVRSGAGFHKAPDITLAFKDAALAASLLTPPINWLDQINAQKDFKLTVDGSEDLTNWWAQTMMATLTAGWRFGTRLTDGTMRYCNMTNGGPVFVYVKDGKIVRMTPIEFDDSDPPPWTIEARGLKLTPPRKTTLAPHGQNAKSIVYSPDRLLYPMK